MAETAVQNDQICAVQLEIIKQPAAAPNGDYVRVSPRTAITRSNRTIRYR